MSILRLRYHGEWEHTGLTAGAAIPWDVHDGMSAAVSITANSVLTLSNHHIGQTLWVHVTQGGAGGFTFQVTNGTDVAGNAFSWQSTAGECAVVRLHVITLANIVVAIDETDRSPYRGIQTDANLIANTVANQQAGDYADNATTGTRWTYNGTQWFDSGDFDDNRGDFTFVGAVPADTDGSRVTAARPIGPSDYWTHTGADSVMTGIKFASGSDDIVRAGDQVYFTPGGTPNATDIAQYTKLSTDATATKYAMMVTLPTASTINIVTGAIAPGFAALDATVLPLESTFVIAETAGIGTDYGLSHLENVGGDKLSVRIEKNAADTVITLTVEDTGGTTYHTNATVVAVSGTQTSIVYSATDITVTTGAHVEVVPIPAGFTVPTNLFGIGFAGVPNANSVTITDQAASGSVEISDPVHVNGQIHAAFTDTNGRIAPFLEINALLAPAYTFTGTADLQVVDGQIVASNVKSDINVTVNEVGTAFAVGEVNTGSNVAVSAGRTGVGVFAGKSALDLRFRNIIQLDGRSSVVSHVLDDIQVAPNFRYADENVIGAAFDWDLDVSWCLRVSISGACTLNDPTNLLPGGSFQLLVLSLRKNNGTDTLALGPAFQQLGGVLPIGANPGRVNALFLAIDVDIYLLSLTIP